MKKGVALLLVMTAFNSTIMAQQKVKEINRDLQINSPIEEVWQVVGHEYAEAYKWASSLKHSEALDSVSLNGSSCTERGCDIDGFGQITEKMLAYSDEEHLLSYEVTSGLPKFVIKTENTWKLSTTTEGKTNVEVRMKMQTKGFLGWLLGGIMERKTEKLLDGSLEELKYYVETGKIHPRTLKANAKAAKSHS